MPVRRAMKLEVAAHAKVNIGWRVDERREDGYHDVNGLLQTISLADRLTIEPSDDLSVSVPGHPSLESSNLVRDAALVLGERAGAKITIEKNIPIAAGLGGGSADAAAALVALNVLWKCEYSARKLVELGGQIGSDVPAILTGGLVHASGRGERARRVGSTSGYKLVLGISETGVPTPDAYRAYDEGIRSESDRIEHNDLEAAACAIDPGLAAKLELMREIYGVAWVSGSGPTIVAIGDEAPEELCASFDRVDIVEPCEVGVVMRLR